VPFLALGPLGLIIVFPIAFVVGVIAVAACLMTLGVPVSLTMGSRLESAEWFWIPLAFALTLSLVIGWISGDADFALLILPYAIPAAVIYRREVLSLRLNEDAAD
jgi:hypothetical protein